MRSGAEEAVVQKAKRFERLGVVGGAVDSTKHPRRGCLAKEESVGNPNKADVDEKVIRL